MLQLIHLFNQNQQLVQNSIMALRHCLRTDIELVVFTCTVTDESPSAAQSQKTARVRAKEATPS